MTPENPAIASTSRSARADIPASRQDHTFRGLQAMRGLAACFVVLFHASVDWSLAVTGTAERGWWAGQAGIDIFFVISGFVMAITAVGKGDGPRAAARFLQRRCVRIYPLYWVITTFLILRINLGLVRSPTGLRHVSAVYAIFSYLLIPFATSPGHPVLGVGWTLSYEMMFYLCFAGALWLRRPVVKTLTIILPVFVIAGFFRSPSWPAISTLLSPLLLEFIGGLWLGNAIRNGYRAPQGRSAALGVLSLAGLCLLGGELTGHSQHVVWFVLGFFIVHAAVTTEDSIGRRIPRWVLLIGDASYSIYLTHTLLLRGCQWLLTSAHVLVMGRVRLQDAAIEAIVALTVSLAIGVSTHLWLERPLNEWARKSFNLKRPVQTTAAAEA